uniref:Conserved hypothetical plastid protein n=1 Tax=Olisthodiscus luteus TaxID=83000 RepID=A0A7U0QGI9_OLILU|nr:conserved hypothetical plastid protein [Olisthodiscus luteus]YP_010152841.1 conserved hypothetical plastid protein [Olisthodiscus luteus]QQW50450.1 conserved hypothetical plastid protein [Olisthodiscus luteus]QQW50502.1 conserved hypothetical plastid protein [Olisthodiscus luteus]
MRILLFGGTGTLGRHIVLKSLRSGYKIRCVVRNLSKAKFLQNWGAEIVYGDLTKIETIPSLLKDVDIVIDASTSRSESSLKLKEIDWEAKRKLLKLIEIAEIRHFIFFSLLTSENYKSVFFLKVKRGIEKLIYSSKIDYTIFKFDGFLQNLIRQYAIPILEKERIWITDESRPFFYLDSADVATICLESLRSKNAKNKTVTITDTKPWFLTDIINLCENLSGQTAVTSKISNGVLKLLQQIANKFEWSWSVSNSLSFVKFLECEKINSQKLDRGMFKVKMQELVPLNTYFKDYFKNILVTLKDITYQQQQKQKDILF